MKKVLTSICLSFLGLVAHADILIKCDNIAFNKLESQKDTESSILNKTINRRFGDGAIGTQVIEWFDELGIKREHYFVKEDSKSVLLQLNVEKDSSSLTFFWNQDFDIKNDDYWLPINEHGKLKKISISSKKEIVYAMLKSGRTWSVKQNKCNLEALIDHVGIRQNIVAWGTKLSWDWPDGEAAKWNKKYWNDGTPVSKEKTVDGLNDMFFNFSKYSIGCYTATKLVMMQAIVDYYSRVKKSKKELDVILNILWKDSDPLVGIEPRSMWKFEKDFDVNEMQIEGKLMELQESVNSDSFIPGDWSYFLNTDPITYEKTGYEGSNAIYLGANKFNDHYWDNDGHYLFHEKLLTVYNWRNKVFSRSRDYEKFEHLKSTALEALANSPENGGVLLTIRAIPKVLIQEN